jgi:hypothetical protein
MKVHTFSSGTEWEIWANNNCFECKKYDEDIKKTCKMEYELGLSRFDDGKVEEKIFDIMNIPNGRCKKFKQI